MNGSLALLAAVLAAIPAAPALAAPDVVIADFEGEDYGQWKTTGEAFGPGPVHGTLPNQHPVSGFAGQGLVNSYLGGDRPQGTLTSPEFKIERRCINFLVGGGAHEGRTCVNLLLDGKAVRTATGQDDELLEWRTWDVADLAGRTVRIEIVDRESGGWGHVNVDQIVQSDERKEAAPVAEELYRETWRPQFHFTARTNWLNDPNGLVFYKGEYHLFFQHNPKGTKWGNMTWGHAVSPDLVHWTQLGSAIEPDALGTIFSGSAVVDWRGAAGFETGGEKVIVAIYTAAGGTSDESKGRPFTQCIAWSADRGRTFKKYEKNPVLPHLVAENRDPKVVWHAPSGRWIMALFKDKNDFAFFASPDLKTWTHLHDITVPGCGECPDFFEMPVDGDPSKTRWVWTAANGQYLVGAFDGSRFTPEGGGPHRADHGGNFYAVQTYSDIPASDGRRIQIAWMNGGKYPRMPFNQQMSFPCTLTLRTLPEGIRMFRMPVREIETLRAKEHKWSGVDLKPGENPLAGLSGDLFEIRAEFEIGGAAEVGLRVRGEPVAYSVKDKRLTCLGRSAPVEAEGGRLNLVVLADRTSLEVFAAGGRASMTTCFLPKPDDKSLAVYSAGGTARIVSLAVYELRSAWPQGGAAK
jgi:sucrose-6-phosphate hydrolase SacC (GH32 family)